jgi:quercetin dioxygenase-like cupin family protein
MDAIFNTALVSHPALQHTGAEFIYVLSGTLVVHIGDDQHTLEAGDSIYFDSSAPHAYRKSGAKACCALVVTTAG